MSKEKQTISKQLAKCPFCGEEMEVHCTSRYYMHKLNGCILQHFCFETDDELSIDLWNTRKPMDRIVERLEHLLKNFGEHCENWGGECTHKSCSDCVLSHAIEIVKEEGEINR